jgi:hypothetical protein
VELVQLVKFATTDTDLSTHASPDTLLLLQEQHNGSHVQNQRKIGRNEAIRDSKLNYSKSLPTTWRVTVLKNSMLTKPQLARSRRYGELVLRDTVATVNNHEFLISLFLN